MIVSISSNINLYTSQTQVGDVVCTWHLANEDKAYLIRNNEPILN